MSPVTRRLSRISRIAAAALVSASLASGAGAQPRDRVDRALSATFIHCMDASGGVTLYMHNCSNAEMERWDRRLNQTYRALMARLSPDRRQALRVEERAWLRAMNRRCDAVDPDGGTSRIINTDGCLLEALVRRTLDLQARR